MPFITLLCHKNPRQNSNFEILIKMVQQSHQFIVFQELYRPACSYVILIFIIHISALIFTGHMFTPQILFFHCCRTYDSGVITFYNNIISNLRFQRTRFISSSVMSANRWKIGPISIPHSN